MAHNIEFNKQKNKHSFFAVREPAWHGLGSIVDSALTSRQAIVEAGLDFEVAMAPIYAGLPSNEVGEDYIEYNSSTLLASPIPDKFATYRTDNNKVFGVVGSRYEPIQNVEAFEFFDNFLGQKAAVFETAGALHDGQVIFITAIVPGELIIGGSDPVKKYLLLASTHDGTGAVQIMFTPTRVVCNNTLNIALRQAKTKITIRHSKSAKDKLATAHELLGITTKMFDNFGNLGNALVNARISDKQLNDYIETVIAGDPIADIVDRYKKQYESVKITGDKTKILAIEALIDDPLSTRMLNTINKIKKYAEIGIGQNTTTAKGTAWGAMNAITGYLSNVKDYKTPEDRMESLLLGSGYDLAQKSLDLAYSKFVS